MTSRSGDSLTGFLAERRARILARIEEACARVGRDPAEVTLFAVSKTVDVPTVIAAMEAGYTCFAENRPQELVRKLAGLEAAGVPAPRFDMVGNLQKNKVNQVLGRVACIQSVSSEHLAEAISSRAAERGILQPVLLEVNVSGEASKAGFSPSEALEATARIAALPGIEVRGLMTMAPAGQPELDRQTFKGLAGLRATLENECGVALSELSCGMSDDFCMAVEEGSTIVRLGRVVFDPDYRL